MKSFSFDALIIISLLVLLMGKKLQWAFYAYKLHAIGNVSKLMQKMKNHATQYSRYDEKKFTQC